MVKETPVERQEQSAPRNRPINKGRPFATPQGPPQRVMPFCTFEHAVGHTAIVVKSTVKDYVPKFNRGVYLQNKTHIGKIGDVFGKVQDYYFSVLLDEGFNPKSFSKGQVLHMSGEDVLPLNRFTHPQKRSGPPGGARGGFRGGRGGGRGGFRGGQRGGFRGGARGGARGGGRGGFRGGRGRQ